MTSTYTGRSSVFAGRWCRKPWPYEIIDRTDLIFYINQFNNFFGIVVYRFQIFIDLFCFGAKDLDFVK